MARTYCISFAAVAVASSAFIFASVIDPQAARAGANGCGSTPYSYAGLQTNLGTHGIAATITAESVPVVAGGHVAGWIGVGGPGEGANGSNAWIQIGLNALPDRGNAIYAEAWIPGQGQVYKELGIVAVGKQVRLAVLEVKGQPGTWRAWVNGKPVTAPVTLQGSEGGKWQADALGESWTGARRVCNSYTYRFANITYATAAGGSWKAVADTIGIQDPGYKVVRHAAATFVATTS